MDEEVNPLERDHTLSVVLPGGLERNATVHGSKPVMDLLVTLCASYRLNPSDYTVEVLSPNKNIISFKPNSPIGLLEAEKIVLKPKGIEEKIRRPYMPEASVRLLINYNKSHKAVVRVNPRVPLEMLLPVVCDKCEFKAETTILMRDSQSKEPLDLTKSLNDLGLREVFAKDTADRQHQAKTPDAAVTQTEVISPPPPQDLPKKEKKQKENLGFLSLFRRRKKHPEMEGAVSPPDSPGLNKQMGGRMNGQDVSSSNKLAADVPKKRRAPQPPMGASQSVPNNLSTCHLRGPQRSAESTLRSTKRRAPPPPCANTHQELQEDTEVKATVDSLITVEKRESEESDSVKSLSSSSSPYPSHSRSSKSSSRPSFAHLHEVADPYLPSFRRKDLSDARYALAKVMTSSISKGTLVRRLRNSATFPKLYNGSSFMSMTQRFSDNRDFYAEPEPVLTSNLPTEPEWEDPAQRRGMTTFKVVPSKKQKSHDPELTLDVPDQITIEENPESEASSEVGKNQTEPEEDPCSPARSETETPLQSPEPSSQETEEPASLPPPLDEDDQDCPGSPFCEVRDTVEKQEEDHEPEVPYLQSPEPSSQEIQASEEPASLPPPLDVDDKDCSGSPLCEVGDIGEKQEEEDEPEVAYLQSPEPSSQEIQASEEPASLPPTPDVDDQDFPGSPLPEAGGAVEKQQEKEDEPEVTSEVVQTTPSDCSDGQIIISEDQSEFLQSPSRQFVSTDIDHCGSYTDEKDVKEEEDSFPPPPPPVFFNEEIEVMEEGREDTTASSLPSSQPLSPSSNGQNNAFSVLTSVTPDQAAAAPKPLDKISSAPSRFAQAVALAVQRSRLQSRGKSLGPQAPSGPQSTLPSPPRTIYQFGA